MTEQVEHVSSQKKIQGGLESGVAVFANRLVLGVARHWLAIFNTVWGLYIGLPILAPILMQLGFYFPARTIYAVYSVLCHQLPDHSYFLFGPSIVPLEPALLAAGVPPGQDLLTQRRFTGNGDIGYKIALCQRDMAIYGSVFLAGVIYSFVRHRIRPLSVKLYILFVIPMAIDGVTQLLGLRESDWLMRSITGAMFGVASVWLAYPYVDQAMQEVIASEEARMASSTATPPASQAR